MERFKNWLSSNKSWATPLLVILALFFIVIGIPLLINGLLYLPIRSTDTVTAGVWLGFWGNFLGGLLGSIAAIAIMFENRYRDKENKEDSHLPCLDCFIYKPKGNFPVYSQNVRQNIKCVGTTLSFSNSSDILNYLPQDNILLKMDITNIGLGPARQISLSLEGSSDIIDLGGMKDGVTNHFLIQLGFLPQENQRDFKFHLTFSNAFDKKYTQSQTISISRPYVGPGQTRTKAVTEYSSTPTTKVIPQ